MSAGQSFLAELQRRHVYKVGAMYCVAGWLLVQVATQVFPFFDVSNAAVRWVVIGVIAGLVPVLVLAWLFDITPQGIVRTADLPATAAESPVMVQQRRGMERKLNYLLGTLLLAALGYEAAQRLAPHRAAADADGGDKSIAVLPFENLSDDKANAYFAVGMQDEILTRLAKIGALKVISRTSTQEYAAHPGNLPEIAAKLGVANILEGSVEKVGGKVRIDVQLIRARDDTHLWAEIYDRNADDILGVQGEVAAAIAEAMNARISGTEMQALVQKPTLNPAAYEEYLRALATESKMLLTPSSLEARITAYRKAVELDPGFAAAWARLARAQTARYFFQDHKPEVLAEAREALDHAERLAPDASETLAARANYLYSGLQDYDAAADVFSKALRASPNSGDLLSELAHVRRRQGHWQDALKLETQAAELDPQNSSIWINLAASQRALGQHEQAQQSLDRAIAVAPDDPFALAQKTFALQLDGALDAAAADAERLPLETDDLMVLQARLYQWQLQRSWTRGIAELRQVLQQPTTQHPTVTAYVLLRLGAEEMLSGQSAAGRRDLGEARDIYRSLLNHGDDNPDNIENVSDAESRLGETQAAIRDADLAVAACAHDAFSLPEMIVNQALVRMRAGETAQAVALLRQALALPVVFEPTLAQLRLDPEFDPLRQDPAFQQLLAAAPTP